MTAYSFGQPSYSFFVYIVIFILRSYSHSGGQLHRLAGCAADILIILLKFGILAVAERFVSKITTLVLILRAAFFWYYIYSPVQESNLQYQYTSVGFEREVFRLAYEVPKVE